MSRRALHDKALARLGAELGTVIKEPGGRTGVCLVYPSPYSIGMSSLGFLGVHEMLNSRRDVYCQRAFLPDPDDIAEHERTRTPVFSIETRRALADFDIIAFSVSFENDYPGVLRVLELSGIPVRASQRDGRHPLIVMGGVCSFSNPEPLADFVDVFLMGEAEGMLDEFMDACASTGEREELLERVARIEGAYVPSLYDLEYFPEGGISRRVPLRGAPDRISPRHVADISARPIRQLITTAEAEFSGMRLVEVQRGCPWSCHFCLAGRVFNPPRRKPLDALTSEISQFSPGSRVGLVGPSLGDYPHLGSALDMDGVDFTITSLRAGRASAELVLAMKGRKSVSIAPEAGSDRLREYINKKVSREDILEAAGMILRDGVERLRLYFMVGLPTETDDDVREIVALVREIRALESAGRISLTLSPFVPKPFTEFQRQPMASAKVLKARIRMVRQGIKGLSGVALRHDPVRDALMQGFLAMGDRRAGRVLELMTSAGGFAGAVREAGIDPDYYVHRRKPDDEAMPWDFIRC